MFDYARTCLTWRQQSSTPEEVRIAVVRSTCYVAPAEWAGQVFNEDVEHNKLITKRVYGRPPAGYRSTLIKTLRRQSTLNSRRFTVIRSLATAAAGDDVTPAMKAASSRQFTGNVTQQGVVESGSRRSD